MTSTALRSGPHEVRDGVRLLRPDPDIPYRDGAEEQLWKIISSATDLRSDSTEMLEVAESWAEKYHTHPARANIVRALDIPADAAVLEVGAGCGPITRYLGETGAQVDAVEPVLPRARVGRARTRDLPNVEVFCGNLEDVPTDPGYDLVVVVGVLEYVGNGEPDREPYLNFLRECRTRLRPGGSLVLAIENKLGVKYLTGTGEDHSGRMFDSVEDYPRGSPARTFSATALLDLVADGGFSPRLFGVFPDYKHTRVVFDTLGLHAAAPDLLENLPSFPSRFAGTRSLRLASEERVWKEFVRDGIADHFANSFLVIGSTAEPGELWPADRLARYFSINRRREYVASTSVRSVAGGIQFDRAYSPEPGPLITAGVGSWEYVPGPSFLEVFVASDDSGRRQLLQDWLQLVRSTTTGDRVPLDAIPSNVIVTDGSRLQLIDSEFHDEGPVERVIERGLFWLAVHLVRTTPPEIWSPARTIRDVLARVADLAGVEVDDATIARLLEQEAAFQIAVSTHYLGPDAQADAVAGLRAICDTNVWDTPLGRRLHHDHDKAVAAQEALQARYDAAIAERSELQQRYENAVETRDDLRSEVRSQKQHRAKLQRAESASRTKAERAERKLAAATGSRTYRFADTVRRGLRKIKPKS